MSVIRKKTKICKVGNVNIGYGFPIVAQTMINELTTDVQKSITQINKCYENGSKMVRLSVPDEDSVLALKDIVKNSKPPLIADLHFNTFRDKIFLGAIKSGVKCIRINPGTITPRGMNMSIERKDQMFKDMIKALKDHECAVRIGVNTGSLDESILAKYKEPNAEAMVESALESIKIFEDNDFLNIKISVKASDPLLTIKSYRLLSEKTDYPLHLGVTEAGTEYSGMIKSSCALGSLLLDGIGDTIRVSLSIPPEEEIKKTNDLLKNIGLLDEGLNLVACPSCARQCFNVIDIANEIEKKFYNIKDKVKISVLGCVVNGLGEALYADIGITGAVNGNHIIYFKGKKYKTCKTNELIDCVDLLVNEHIQSYPIER